MRERRGRGKNNKTNGIRSLTRPSKSRTATTRTSTRTKKSDSKTPSTIQDEKAANQEAQSANPFVKLHNDVQKLKKALEIDDKTERTSKSKSFEPQAPKDQTKVSVRRLVSRDSSVSSGGAAVADVRRLDSGNAEGLEGTLPAGSRSLKSALVNGLPSTEDVVRAVPTRKKIFRGVPSTKKITRTVSPEKRVRKRPTETLLRSPRRSGSERNVTIEVVNAKALELSGNAHSQNIPSQKLISSAVAIDQPPVPNLSHGLERVLFK